MFPTNFDDETRVQANLMLDWSTTSEATKDGRIDECLKYIRRIVEKRHLVILLILTKVAECLMSMQCVCQCSLRWFTSVELSGEVGGTLHP